METPRYTKVRRALATAFVVVLLAAGVAFISWTSLVRQMLIPEASVDQGHEVITVSLGGNGRIVGTGDFFKDIRSSSRPTTPTVFVTDRVADRLLRGIHGSSFESPTQAVSPDGTQIAMFIQIPPNPTLSVADVATGRTVWAAPLVWGDLDNPLIYSPDGRWIAFGGRVYDAHTGKLAFVASKEFDQEDQTAFSRDGELFGAAVMPDFKTWKSLLNSSSLPANTWTHRLFAQNRFHIWSTRTGKELYDLPYICPAGFAFGPDRHWCVLNCLNNPVPGGFDGSILRRIDLETGKVDWTVQRTLNDDPSAGLTSVVVSPNGKYVIACSDTGQLIVYESSNGREVFRTLAGVSRGAQHWEIPNGLAISADGRTVASRSAHGALIWDASRLQ